MAKKNVDVFDESNEVKSNWAKFSVPQEDKIFGTLIAKRQVKSNLPGKEGEMVMVYDLKADYGTFHALDDKKRVIEEPITVEAGTFWSVGGKPMIDRQMQNIKLGQKIGFKFIEEVPSKQKGFNPTKVIKVFAPSNPANPDIAWMDEEWLEANKGESFN